MGECEEIPAGARNCWCWYGIVNVCWGRPADMRLTHSQSPGVVFDERERTEQLARGACTLLNGLWMAWKGFQRYWKRACQT